MDIGVGIVACIGIDIGVGSVWRQCRYRCSSSIWYVGGADSGVGIDVTIGIAIGIHVGVGMDAGVGVGSEWCRLRYR